MNRDDDLPEWSDDLVPKAVPAQDLHLGAAKVKPFNRSWAQQHGPKPPGLSIHALDLLIATMASVVVWEIITVWWWIIAT
jgi:hypothetical protein